MQTICVLPVPQPRIHACIRLSVARATIIPAVAECALILFRQERRRRALGTIAVPCFVVTESCGKLPVWAFRNKAQLSTGAQSFAWQHSSG